MAAAPQRVALSPQQQADLASLMYELSQGDTRKDLAKLVKKKFPERAAKSFRDVEQEEQVETRFAEIEDKLDLKGAKAAKQKQDEQRAKLADKYGEDQLKGIDEVATRYGLSDLDAAAVLYANEHPEIDPTLQPPPPGERPGATWEFPTVAGKDGKPMDFKTFAADPKTHSLNAAYGVITEFKNKSLSPAFRR
jgi:hypothetical protein